MNPTDLDSRLVADLECAGESMQNIILYQATGIKILPKVGDQVMFYKTVERQSSFAICLENDYNEVDGGLKELILGILDLMKGIKIVNSVSGSLDPVDPATQILIDTFKTKVEKVIK